MPSLDLREYLRVEVVVVEGQPPLPRGEDASILPAVGDGDEVVGRGQLDVHSELVLQPRDSAEHALLLGDQKDVDVERARPPAQEDCGGAAREVDRAVLCRFRAEYPHEAADALGVG
jgi:hypothetical protein